MADARNIAQPPDNELVDKAKAGDKQAFVTLFDRYKDRVVRYLRAYLGDYEEARDVTLQAFMRAHKSLETCDVRSFSSWIYAIATNCAKKSLGKTIGRQEISLEKPVSEDGALVLADMIASEQQRPDQKLVIEDLQEFIHSLIAKLDEKYRQVLILSDIEGLSYDEIAHVLGCNPMTVGTRLRRARLLFYDIARKYRSEL